MQRYWMLEAAMLVLVTGVAVYRGRPSERWVVLVWWAAALASPVVENMRARHGANIPILAVDTAVAVIFAFLAVRYAHWWIIVAAGSALFQLFIHGAMLARTGIPIHAYYVALEMAGDLITGLIGVGVVAAMNARRVRLAP